MYNSPMKENTLLCFIHWNSGKLEILTSHFEDHEKLSQMQSVFSHVTTYDAGQPFTFHRFCENHVV